MPVTHQTAVTEYAVFHSELKYAYRRFGKKKDVPLLFLMHFRGTMDYWDPLLVNSIAAHREIILFDNAGVGHSTGAVATSGKEMAQHVVNFLSLLGIAQVDILGFCIGGVVAQLVYLNGPRGLVRRLILAASAVTWGPAVAYFSTEHRIQMSQIAALPQESFESYFGPLFFLNTPTSWAAGKACYKRIYERNPSTSGEERSLRVSHEWKDGGVGLRAMVTSLSSMADPQQRGDGSYDRLGDIRIPVFISQGKNDFMVPISNSYLLQQKLPYAWLKIFPDSGHGFLYQFAEQFAEDIKRFLDAEISFDLDSANVASPAY
ncbi:Alpha/Beta hydrolase protein [Xylogone sp. PMI_703]|nr:Alpha/Beta hydrolase protein [Xylogone sp. PMI_703]